MPELPDVLLYIEVLKPRILHQTLERVRLASPFVVRSVSPPISSLHGRTVALFGRVTANKVSLVTSPQTSELLDENANDRNQKMISHLSR